MSRDWKAKCIHTFTPIAGNFPGQGSVWLALFSGLNIQDFSFPATAANAGSSARMYLTTPSTYISSADPKVFDNQETIVQDLSTGRRYSPAGYPPLLEDAGLASFKSIARFYVVFLNMSSSKSFPGVDVYAEKGSGLPTVVGASQPNLTVGQVLDPNTTPSSCGTATSTKRTSPTTPWPAGGRCLLPLQPHGQPKCRSLLPALEQRRSQTPDPRCCAAQVALQVSSVAQ